VASHWARLTRLEIRGPHPSQEWVFQTNMRFDLRVSGVGLRDSNRIKIVLGTDRCDDASALNWHRLHSGSVYQPYFNSSLLKQNSSFWDFSGHTGGNPILDITDWFAKGSTLRFQINARRVGTYVDVMKAGDVITIGNITVDMNGQHPYLFPASEAHKEIISVPWGHTLTMPVEGDETGTLYVINAVLLHPDGSVPTWSGSMRASWVRTSEQMYEGIEALDAREGLRVCWSDTGETSDSFVAEAGVLRLEDAPQMAFCTMSLTASASDTAGPAVIAFGTSVSSALRYEVAENSMMLRINVQDPHISARAADSAASDIADDTVHNDLYREDQALCGLLFKEVWSSHVNGFPVPKGCYYRHFEKSYFVVFDKKNGLAASTEYQIVMNLEASTAPGGTQYWERTAAVRLSSVDDVVLRREFAVEVGSCHLRPSRLPAVPARAHAGAAQLAPNGFKIVAGSSGTSVPEGVVDSFTYAIDLGVLSFEVRGLHNAPVRAGHNLRIFLWPLTAWHLGEICQASCEHLNVSLVCGVPRIDEPLCVPEALCAYDGAQRNVVKVVLPQELDNVDNATALKMTISGLTPPLGGMFPSRLAAELTGSDDLRPHYTRSSGRLVYVPPNLIFGSIVNAIDGDGNDRPFRGDHLNVLYVRLVLGATIRSQPMSAQTAAALEVLLPNGYTCVEVGESPSTLAVFGGDSPQGRGSLRDLDAEDPYALGAWSLHGNRCRYQLRSGGALFAGSAIMLRISVDNPFFGLPRHDERNVWRVTLESYVEGGPEGVQAHRTPGLAFRGGAGAFGDNVAVLGQLAASISPLDLTPSSPTNDLHVFFFTEQGAGSRAQLRIVGPRLEPFDFGKRCKPALLGERYYVDVSPMPSTFPLPGAARQISCNGLQSQSKPSRYYGALLQLSGRLRGQRQYGFAIRVGNPDDFVPTHTQEWSILTLTADSEEIDGTRATVPLNPRPAAPSSFGIYLNQPSQADLATSFVLSLGTQLPSTVTESSSWVAIGGIAFPMSTSCQLRVIAPALFEWSYVMREFLYRPPEVLPHLPQEGRLSDGSALVDDDLPVGFVPMPVLEPLNKLEWHAVGNFRANTRYGFAAKILVPDRPNTASINAFYIQCGFQGSSLVNRPLSAVCQAPTVAALVDAAVGYTSSIAGAANRLSFRVRTTTAIRSSGALVIQGPPGFASSPLCSVASTSMPLNERLARLRTQFVAYEALAQRQQMVLATSGEDSIEYHESTVEVEARVTDLRELATALWADRILAHALPLDVGCRFDPESDVRPTVQLTLQIGLPNLDVDARLGAFVRRSSPDFFEPGHRLESWLPSGLYEFDVEVSNPTQVRGNERVEPSSSRGGATVSHLSGVCGYEQCWEFAAYAAPFSLFSLSDRVAVAKGFSVVTPMRDAYLVGLTDKQRRAVQQNHRPQQPNQLVFVFTLVRAWPESVAASSPVTQELVLRGPKGFTFPEDCVVVTAPAAVFGGFSLWPASLALSLWTNETGAIKACEGLDNVAMFTVEGHIGLEAGKRYAFRIDVSQNPRTTPLRNLWTIEFWGHRAVSQERRHAEASMPFKGFRQWSFSNVDVVPMTTERSTGVRTDPEGGITRNLVKFLFRPLNAVAAPGGALRLQAPSTFAWVRVAANSSEAGESQRCDATVREEPANMSQAGLAVIASGSLGVSFWEELQVVCSIHRLLQNVMFIEFVGDSGLVPEIRYALVATLENPILTNSVAETFELSSWAPGPVLAQAGATAMARGSSIAEDMNDMEPFDFAEIAGFVVTKSVDRLSVIPASGLTARGGVAIKLRVSAGFVEPVFPGDVVRLVLPPGYSLLAQGASARDQSRRSRCARVINLSKPGVFPEQLLRCFVGLLCKLAVWGVSLAANSHIQLNRLDRPCGSLPGRGIDIRRTRADASDSTVEKQYQLGFAGESGHFRVCYCHGDGGCAENKYFCQEVGNLTIVDLCEGASCPPARGLCRRACDPRTGKCADSSTEPPSLPDGVGCGPDSDHTDGGGPQCEGGICVGLEVPASINSTTVAPNSTVRRMQSSPSSLSPFSAVDRTSCVFDAFECTERALVWIVGHDGYRGFAMISLEVTARHPETSPPEDNRFAISHERAGLVRSTRVVAAYAVLPQFRFVAIGLVGRLRAGGALSAVELRLLPVSPASSVWLRAKEPIGFDFSQTSVVPANISILVADGDTIEVATSVRTLQLLRLRFEGVRLPLVGGAGRFDVITFNGSAIRGSMYDIAAFRTPAHVDVSEAALLNQYKRDTTGMFRVEATFGNRLGEWAQMRLRLRLSAGMPAGCRLRVAAPSWRISPLSAQLREFQDTLEPVPMNFSVSSLGQPEEDGSAAILDVVLEQALYSQLHHSYILSVDILAPQSMGCLCWISQACLPCNSHWTVEVLDDGELPFATNDATSVGFPLVSELRWLIFAARAPPYARLEVNLRFMQIGAVPATLLIVTAPLGYEFPYKCMVGDASNETTETLPHFRSCIGRLSTATLRMREDGLFRPTTVMLTVTTPRVPPADNRWYLEGRLADGNVQVGWSMLDGLVSEELRDVSVAYGTFQEIRTFFLVRLTPDVDVQDEGVIVVLPPSGYLLKCDGFRQYALPSSGHKDFAISCADEWQGVAIRFVHAVLRAGVDYSFGLVGSTASASAEISSLNAFTVQVLQRRGNVVESNYEVPAGRLLAFGGVESPYLLWYDTPAPNTVVWATLGFKVPLSAPAGLEAVRITVPQGLEHAVLVTSRFPPSPTGVSVAWERVSLETNPLGTFSDYLEWVKRERNDPTNDTVNDLPLVSDLRRWLDLGQRSRVGIRFETSKPFPACELLVRFRVRLPNTLPTLNVWRLALVFANGDEASFVLPGFNFGEASDPELVTRALHIFAGSGLEFYEFSKQFADTALRHAWPCSALLTALLIMFCIGPCHTEL